VGAGGNVAVGCGVSVGIGVAGDKVVVGVGVFSVLNTIGSKDSKPVESARTTSLVDNFWRCQPANASDPIISKEKAAPIVIFRISLHLLPVGVTD
jgi:hypothetical protein